MIVTGGNRTGTSWVGRNLCLSRELFLVWESFNQQDTVPLLKHPLEKHYRRLLPREEPVMADFIRKKMWIEMLRSAEGGPGLRNKLRKLARALSNYYGYITGGKKPLFKDPIALMSAPWLAEEFNARVVLTVRHPGAYVNSIKRLNWPTRVEEFEEQPWLMKTLPETLQEEIRARIASREPPRGYVLEDAALYWKVFYTVVDGYRKTHPGWITVFHEDLSRDYIDGFKALYEKLDLTWTESIEATIEAQCNPGNEVVQGKVSHHFVQDSAGVSVIWKTRLTDGEKSTIRRITEPVSSLYYNDSSWE